ncbi:hypothetical protein KIN20_023062 [Parelaphostrongylus tenuis]|uniref:C2H2-type domain-containing protein n=1 Tax=Parelaphostrongylus tenuis TaxID=148309 RepID=A0AAD5MR22_PARTN|nr:hypothetical protein KIN20_023062 [Parelaphostrongylus tenuis]
MAPLSRWGTCGDIKLSKTNCTAFMKVGLVIQKQAKYLIVCEIQCWTRRDGSVEVIACTEHVGHEKDPRKLLLGEKQEDELRRLISVFGTQKNNYKCPQCDEGPMPIEKLRRHIREVHERVDETANTMVVSNTNDKNGAKWSDIYYCCEECQFLCFTESILDAHVQASF